MRHLEEKNLLLGILTVSVKSSTLCATYESLRGVSSSMSQWKPGQMVDLLTKWRTKRTLSARLSRWNWLSNPGTSSRLITRSWYFNFTNTDLSSTAYVKFTSLITLAPSYSTFSTRTKLTDRWLSIVACHPSRDIDDGTSRRKQFQWLSNRLRIPRAEG